MRSARLLILTAAIVSTASPAFADATAFIGSTATPSNRTTKGFALGVTLVVVGVEFEYSDASEEFDQAAPSLRTGMANVFVQTPLAIAGFQPYATTGAGGYRERLGERQESHIGFNTGGGVKISLLGPVAARLDYRVFKLRGDPLHSTVHRLYAGINLKF